ncbi:MAG: carbamoyl-phosphate synthase (glutamine-hydrolyzing) large subunit [Bacteroidales bacterium]|nr:carbamoyl-phosphate synthase (glutamine-hydrolyzing) large subunit [Candidatus Colicola coprequi]
MKKVLLLGSGALKIGQAGEFDYSGSQALKAMREEGIETVLVNPNIATVQTSQGVADKIYFVPVTVEEVQRVIEKERPDGILLSFGGQTALNCGVALHEQGILDKYGVQVLGTPVQAIMDTEDRELFVNKLSEIDVKTIKSHPAHTMAEAKAAAQELGYPLIIRAAYALGGLGSGFVDNEQQLEEICEKAFSFSGQVLVEKSLKGWKEIEYEVVRDRDNHCMIVCDMENFDPLGIHTGESIVVAPTQNLTPEDCAFLEDLAIRIVEHIGIVGECNVQFAYNQEEMDYRVIEVNARLSRSSALASKATGYPLALVAAKIGLGYTLNQLPNANTRPIVDYVVCKTPRWDLNKFHHVNRKIGSSMKSVGEVMAIGKSFEEVIQKSLRMIGQGAEGFVGNKPTGVQDVQQALREPTDSRIFVLSEALQQGMDVEEIYRLTKIARGFLQKLKNIVDTHYQLAEQPLTEQLIRTAKQQGFSDKQIAKQCHKTEDEVREWRIQQGITPNLCRITTYATPHPEQSNYLYLTYSGQNNYSPQTGNSIIVLGSGAYRIGSSVEFDWCSVSCLQEIQKNGFHGVMVNYNPETVSTDYDMCDRLYFDELTLERVLDICDIENANHDSLVGVVVSVGGQIPNNLALPLKDHGINILGTSADNIDRAEDRHKFSSIVDSLGIDQPEWSELKSMADVDNFIARVGFPVLVRPSYVLSGAAMNVCFSRENLQRYFALAAEVSEEHPVVVSKFISRCMEVEFDAVADHGHVLASAVSEHIEYAGVHSGDATIVFPAQRLYVETVRRCKKIAAQIADALQITGPFNIQFLAKENMIKVIECNLRASRSFPFVSKVLKVNLIELATQAMLGKHPDALLEKAFDLDYVGVKSSQFSFARLENADPMLGVDMCSTGEVGCLGDTMHEALLRSVISVGNRVPRKRILLSTGDALQKADMLSACQLLAQNGYELYATGGTYKYLVENNIPCRRVLWPTETNGWELEGLPRALDLIQNKQVDMVINIPKNFTETELTNGYHLRRAAVDFNIPLFTNARLATEFIRAFCKHQLANLPITAWDEY